MFHPRGPTFWELARQCLSATDQGYDLLAPKFDYTPFRTPDFVLDGLAKVLGPERSIEDALDVCCGTGAALRILRPLAQKRVVGIDFSQGMLEVARQHYPAALSDPRVDFVHGNVLEMEFREEFDLAITVGSLGHILPRDEPQFIQRIHAALRPGGRFAFVTTGMPSVWSAAYLLSRGFNAAMHARNLVKRPPFVMFYLTFLLPEIAQLLERQGFHVRVHDDAFTGRLKMLKAVVATKK